MYRTNWLSALAVGLVVAGCTATESDPATDTAAVRQELTDRLAAFGASLVLGETEQVLAFWTPDSRLLEPGMDLSHDELGEFLRDLFSTGGVVSVDFEAYDQFVHGEVAYEVGQYDETVEVEGEQQMIQGYYFVRWEKGTDAVWRIDRVVAGPREAPAGM